MLMKASAGIAVQRKCLDRMNACGCESLGNCIPAAPIKVLLGEYDPSVRTTDAVYLAECLSKPFSEPLSALLAISRWRQAAR